MGNDKSYREECIHFTVADKHYVKGVNDKLLDPIPGWSKDKKLQKNIIEEFSRVPHPPSKLVGKAIPFNEKHTWAFSREKVKNGPDFIKMQMVMPGQKIPEKSKTQYIRSPPMELRNIGNVNTCYSTGKGSFFTMHPIDADISPDMNNAGQKYLEMRRQPVTPSEDDGCAPCDHYFMQFTSEEDQQWLVDNKYLPRTGMSLEDIAEQRKLDAEAETKYYDDIRNSDEKDKKFTDCKFIFFRKLKPSERVALDLFKGSTNKKCPKNERYPADFLDKMAGGNSIFEDLNIYQGEKWFSPFPIFHCMDINTPLNLSQIETLKDKRCIGVVIEQVKWEFPTSPDGHRPNALTTPKGIVMIVTEKDENCMPADSALARLYNIPTEPTQSPSSLEKVFNQPMAQSTDSNSDEDGAENNADPNDRPTKKIKS